MSEENIKRFNESVHSLYNAIMDKPLQVLGIFNDFFGADKVDMQGVWNEDRLRSWLEVEPITSYLYRGNSNVTSSEWDTYHTKSIMDLSQSELEWALSSLSCRDTIEDIVSSKFNNMFILVHFPHVRITNEHDKYVDINHLWAKIKITSDGTMNGIFALNRSEYQAVHFMSNYLHSHVGNIPKDDFTRFQYPCTGSGPINDTMSSLHREFNSDLWQLFCLELSKYITVESIVGRPYKYLERIGTGNMDTGVSSFTVFNTPVYWYTSTEDQDKLREFVKYFVQGNHLKFNYVNGSYSIGMSFVEFIVLISNEFIKWYNEQFNDKKMIYTLEDLKRCRIVRECIINNGKIYYNRNRGINNLTSYIGKRICTFKGKEITLNIVDIPEVDHNKSIILDPQTALFILNQILKVLNYRYGRKTATHTEYQVGTEVRYL